MKKYKVTIYWPHDATQQFIVEGTLWIKENCYYIEDKDKKCHYYPMTYTKIDEQ